MPGSLQSSSCGGTSKREKERLKFRDFAEKPCHKGEHLGKISVNVIIMQSIVIMVNDPGSGSHSLTTRNHTQKSLELTVELKELLNSIHDLRIHV